MSNPKYKIGDVVGVRVIEVRQTRDVIEYVVDVGQSIYTYIPAMPEDKLVPFPSGDEAGKLVVGDMVALKSGGPTMTVTYVSKYEPPAVDCHWFDAMSGSMKLWSGSPSAVTRRAK